MINVEHGANEQLIVHRLSWATVSLLLVLVTEVLVLNNGVAEVSGFRFSDAVKRQIFVSLELVSFPKLLLWLREYFLGTEELCLLVFRGFPLSIFILALLFSVAILGNNEGRDLVTPGLLAILVDGMRDSLSVFFLLEQLMTVSLLIDFRKMGSPDRRNDFLLRLSFGRI